jgi:hypothetical protein
MAELNEIYTKKKQGNFYAEKEQELFTHETMLLRETLKDVNWKINKELCNKILGYEKPPAVINSLIETFMYTLDQTDVTWNNFKVRNFVK